ncbi:hypothetical protein GCM10009794_21020 [Rothia terrae]
MRLIHKGSEAEKKISARTRRKHPPIRAQRTPKTRMQNPPRFHLRNHPLNHWPQPINPTIILPHHSLHPHPPDAV